MTYNFHSPMAKALFDKIQHQNEHNNTSHKEWYSIREKYLSASLLDKFIQMNQDEETKQFIENCFIKSDWIFTQIYHGVAKSFLTWFISATSANGLLNRGSMFVFSKSQISQLLQLETDNPLDRLLDLGAGDGNITLKFRPFFKELFATEISKTMRWRLEQKQINLLDIDSWTTFPHKFDVISCLNLLDRCDRPLTLLQDIRRMLRPKTGLLLLAVVFPIKQYVENNADHRPTELLDLALTKIWEVQLTHFIREVIEPVGFEVIRWTRLPYLCEGDFSKSFYSLNDVVFVLRSRYDEISSCPPSSSSSDTATDAGSGNKC